MKRKGLTTEEKNKIKVDNIFKKECSKCKNYKLINSFNCKKEKNNFWYFGICNQCSYKRKLERCSNKTIKKYVKNQKYKEDFTLDGRASMLLNRCRQRAKKYNYKFNLTKKIIKDKLEKRICEKTGINLIIDNSNYNPYSPSIDRINSNLGYTENNIQVTCMIYNFCKNKFTDNQVNKFFKDMKKI
jgi:hypothetical protein